ncbi:MAG TPA: hypothetical protein VHP80_16305 [Candidatus Acidoferrum sp.]|nr:hypothetical protein [Candidatus Acidoferrum sp.]
MEIVATIGGIFILLIWYGVLTLPGTFLIYFLWKPAGRLSSDLSKRLAQSALIAIAYAPFIYGHAGPLPAAFAIIGFDRLFLTQALISIGIFFVISLAILSIHAFYRNRRAPDRIAGE